MTGTDFCVNKPHMSRSYLNHLVPDAVCRVLDSWWWTERQSETCRVLFQK